MEKELHRDDIPFKVHRLAASPNSARTGEIARLQIDAAPFFTPVRATIARRAGLATYLDSCDAHGVTSFDSCTLRCVACPLPVEAFFRRDAARHYGLRTYFATCETHGEVLHGVQRGKCLTCFNTLGQPRGPDRTSARSLARLAGSKTYRAICAVHGDADHGVQRGKCLTCFNSQGAPRPAR